MLSDYFSDTSMLLIRDPCSHIKAQDKKKKTTKDKNCKEVGLWDNQCSLQTKTKNLQLPSSPHWGRVQCFSWNSTEVVIEWAGLTS